MLALWPVQASARKQQACPAGGKEPLPELQRLIDNLGETIGEPLECLHANLENGDLLQQTTTGLLIYRPHSRTALFTNGWLHWAVNADGLEGWPGSGLDPPWLEIVAASGAAPGGAALVAARTSAGASCSISYLTPSGSPSRAAGLQKQEANADGYVLWTWRIGVSTRRGQGQVTVACDGAVGTEVLRVD